MKKIETAWNFILHIPDSRSKKAQDCIEKYQSYLTDEFITGKKRVFCYKFGPEYFIEPLDDYSDLYHLKDADYRIVREGKEYDRFAEGHHCYAIKFADDYPKGNLPPCFKGYYGRVSFGCNYIPIYETVADWNQAMYEDFLRNRSEIFWYQLGYKRWNKWIIDKAGLKALAYNVAEEKKLYSCPIFSLEKIYEIIDKLPNFIPMNDKDFEFIPLGEIKKKKSLDISSLVIYNKDSILKNYDVRRPTHIALRKMQNPPYSFKIFP